MVGLDPSRIARRVRAERDHWGVPGVALAVAEGGRIETVADGVCDVTTGEPVTADTRFRIASITKPFTATLAMTLVDDGLLGLDDALPVPRARLTLRQALSHTGGLACEWPSPVEHYGSGDDALLCLADDEPERMPIDAGEMFSYSNAGFWLVGAAVSRITGKTFEEAMRERVLAPLGLDQTSFEPANAARGHVPVTSGATAHRPVAQERYPRTRRPSGGVYSSVSDLVIFARHHLGEPGPLRRESVAVMQQPQAERPGGAYGLGWVIDERGGARVVSHTGSVAGYQSLLVLAPDEGVALAALTNSARGMAVVTRVLEEVGLAPPEPRPVEVPAHELARVAGVYRHQTAEFRVAVDDGRLRVEQRTVDSTTGEPSTVPPVYAVPVGRNEFAVLDGEAKGVRLSVPRPGFLCAGVLCERVDA